MIARGKLGLACTSVLAAVIVVACSASTPEDAAIEEGRFLDAVKADVDAVREINPTRYEVEIQQMGEYIWRFGAGM